MLIAFFDKPGVIHKELMPDGQTVNTLMLSEDR
jgi:hypothetical protein